MWRPPGGAIAHEQGITEGWTGPWAARHDLRHGRASSAGRARGTTRAARARDASRAGSNAGSADRLSAHALMLEPEGRRDLRTQTGTRAGRSVLRQSSKGPTARSRRAAGPLEGPTWSGGPALGQCGGTRGAGGRRGSRRRPLRLAQSAPLTRFAKRLTPLSSTSISGHYIVVPAEQVVTRSCRRSSCR